jgi:hypothetical protein
MSCPAANVFSSRPGPLENSLKSLKFGIFIEFTSAHDAAHVVIDLFLYPHFTPRLWNTEGGHSILGIPAVNAQ